MDGPIIVLSKQSQEFYPMETFYSSLKKNVCVYTSHICCTAFNMIGFDIKPDVVVVSAAKISDIQVTHRTLKITEITQKNKNKKLTKVY